MNFNDFHYFCPFVFLLLGVDYYIQLHFVLIQDRMLFKEIEIKLDR